MRPVFVVALSMVAAAAAGQDYPQKPLRIIAAAAGGGGDFTARLIAQALSPALGQQVVVDNRNGSLLASEAASKAAPDGYSMLVNGASLWVIPLLQRVPYDPIRDFSPVSLIAREVSIVVVHPSLPVKSVADLIALAKSRPGELNFAYASPGSSSHLGAELIKSMAGINIVGIPYKASAPAITAVLSGEAQITVFNPSSVAHLVKAGRLRALAVTSAEPSALVPGLPPVAASGLPGYEATSMTGMLAPVKTPSSIINRLNQEIARVLVRADVKEKFLNASIETVGSTPEQFAAVIKNDMAHMDKLLKQAGIKTD